MLPGWIRAAVRRAAAHRPRGEAEGNQARRAGVRGPGFRRRRHARRRRRRPAGAVQQRRRLARGAHPQGQGVARDHRGAQLAAAAGPCAHVRRFRASWRCSSPEQATFTSVEGRVGARHGEGQREGELGRAASGSTASSPSPTATLGQLLAAFTRDFSVTGTVTTNGDLRACRERR